MVLVNIYLVARVGESIFSSTSWPLGCLLLIKVHSDIKSSLAHSGHEVLVGWTLVPVLSHSEARVLTALCYLSCTETYLVKSHLYFCGLLSGDCPSNSLPVSMP